MKTEKTYSEKTLQNAMRFYSRMMRDANRYVPTDLWLSAARAKKANSAWQTMMSSAQDILRCCAEEKMKWPE